MRKYQWTSPEREERKDIQRAPYSSTQNLAKKTWERNRQGGLAFSIDVKGGEKKQKHERNKKSTREISET